MRVTSSVCSVDKIIQRQTVFNNSLTGIGRYLTFFNGQKKKNH